jgi:hypothetical protein
MSKPNKPAVKPAAKAACRVQYFTIRNRDGSTETLTTSSSTVRAVKSAAKTYRRALKELADE